MLGARLCCVWRPPTSRSWPAAASRAPRAAADAPVAGHLGLAADCALAAGLGGHAHAEGLCGQHGCWRGRSRGVGGEKVAQRCWRAGRQPRLISWRLGWEAAALELRRERTPQRPQSDYLHMYYVQAWRPGTAGAAFGGGGEAQIGSGSSSQVVRPCSQVSCDHVFGRGQEATRFTHQPCACAWRSAGIKMGAGSACHMQMRPQMRLPPHRHPLAPAATSQRHRTHLERHATHCTGREKAVRGRQLTSAVRVHNNKQPWLTLTRRRGAAPPRPLPGPQRAARERAGGAACFSGAPPRCAGSCCAGAPGSRG
jgi:hypothetical protein